MEQPLEKKSGVRFGPPGSKRMVYFLDDLNMPFVDKYDTQSAIELARQSIDYKGWYAFRETTDLVSFLCCLVISIIFVLIGMIK